MFCPGARAGSRRPCAHSPLNTHSTEGTKHTTKFLSMLLPIPIYAPPHSYLCSSPFLFMLLPIIKVVRLATLTGLHTLPG